MPVGWWYSRIKKKILLSFHCHEAPCGSFFAFFFLYIIFPILGNWFTRNLKKRRRHSSRMTRSNNSSQSRTVRNWWYFWWRCRWCSRFWSKNRRMGARVNRGGWWWWWCRRSRGDYGGPPSLCRYIRRWFSSSRWTSRGRTPRWREGRRRLSISFNRSKICKLSKTSRRSYKGWKKWCRYTSIDATNNLHTNQIS